MRSKLNRKKYHRISTMVNKWLTDGRLFDGLMLRLVGSDFGSISIVIVCIFSIILHVTHMQRRCRMHVLVLQNVFDTKMVSNVYHSKADTSHHECWFVNLPSENVSETSDQKTSLKICIFHMNTTRICCTLQFPFARMLLFVKCEIEKPVPWCSLLCCAVLCHQLCNHVITQHIHRTTSLSNEKQILIILVRAIPQKRLHIMFIFTLIMVAMLNND